MLGFLMYRNWRPNAVAGIPDFEVLEVSAGVGCT